MEGAEITSKRTRKPSAKKRAASPAKTQEKNKRARKKTIQSSDVSEQDDMTTKPKGVDKDGEAKKRNGSDVVELLTDEDNVEEDSEEEEEVGTTDHEDVVEVETESADAQLGEH